MFCFDIFSFDGQLTNFEATFSKFSLLGSTMIINKPMKKIRFTKNIVCMLYNVFKNTFTYDIIYKRK